MKNKQTNVGSFATAKLQAKRRSLLVIIAIVAVIGFWVTACDNGNDNDGGTPVPVAITIAAIPGVTVPVAGGTPVTAITPTAQYTGTVSWNGSPATFAESTQYTATINLIANSGFTLQGVAAGFFNVAKATSVNNAANSGTVTATFPATGVVSGIATLQFTSVQVEQLTSTPHPVYGALGLDIPGFSNYDGNLTLTNTSGGTGSVANGKFSFSIGTPSWTDTMYGSDNKFGCACAPNADHHDNNNDHGMLDWLFVLWTPYTNVTANVPAAKGTTIYDFRTDSGGSVFKGDSTVSIVGNNITVAHDSVIYIYVDQNVTITAQQATQQPDGDSPFPTTYPALNLALKQGWNMVKRASVTTVNTGANPPATMSGSQTSTFTLGDSHRWVFMEEE
jgi:hypothetical protein